MDIDAQDCRLVGFRAGRNALWYKAIHLPTGIVVEFANGLNKREAMNRLQKAVDEHAALGQSAEIA